MPDKYPIVYISKEDMFATFKRILLQYGFLDTKASTCANIFTQNSLDGVYTHGVNRFPRFIKYLQNNWIQPNAEPSLVSKFGGIEIWDGNLGPGPTNASFITDKVIDLAAQTVLPVLLSKTQITGCEEDFMLGRPLKKDLLLFPGLILSQICLLGVLLMQN